MSKLLAALSKAKKQSEAIGIAAEDFTAALSSSAAEEEVSNLQRGAERYIKYPDARIDYSVYQVECKEYMGAKAWHIFLARQLLNVTSQFSKDFFTSSQPECFLGWLGMTTSTRYMGEWYLYPMQLCCNCGSFTDDSTVFATNACKVCWSDEFLYRRTVGLQDFAADRINGIFLNMHHKDKAIVMDTILKLMLHGAITDATKE